MDHYERINYLCSRIQWANKQYNADKISWENFQKYVRLYTEMMKGLMED